MSPLGNAVSAALIHSLWQDALVVVLLAAALVFWRHRTANARYLACCVALVLIALIPAVTAGMLYLRAMAPTVVTAATETTEGASAVAGSVPARAAIQARSDAQQGTWIPLLQQWALPFWSVGVLMFSLRLVYGNAQAIALRRRAEPADGAIRSIVARLAGRMGIARSIAVFVSSITDSPATLGWIRPVILLPPATALGITPQQFEALLAHELAHIRRHDYAANVAQMVVETLYFYHPGVWWVSKRIRFERELCCDDIAVGLCGDRVGYAQALTSVARLRVGQMAVAAGGGPLVRRIQRILGLPTPASTSSPTWITAVVMTTALALGVVLGIGGPVAGGALKASPTSQQQDVAAVRLPALGEAVTFDTASVRANTSGGQGRGAGTKGRTYTATNQTVRLFIAVAYGIAGPQSFRLVGGPSWIEGDRFDVVATLPEGSTVRQVPSMLRALLADRFKLVVHTEIRDAPMFALVIARGDGRLGRQLRKASTDCEAEEAAGKVIPPPKPGERGLCDAEIGGTVLGRGQRLTSLARMLGGIAGRPVVDRTGLTGAFDFDLALPDLRTGPDSAGPGGDAGGGVFTALQEQLGLKLESIRGSLEVVVIDRIERPTVN